MSDTKPNLNHKWLKCRGKFMGFDGDKPVHDSILVQVAEIDRTRRGFLFVNGRISDRITFEWQ